MKSYLLLVVIFMFLSCSPSWTKYINNGSVSKSSFEEKIDIDTNNHLILVEVEIKAKKYTFLFDSGAPLSISQSIQDDFSFKKISSGFIIDSDANRKRVNWISLDELKIGNLSFNNQTAFVGDFNSNPTLKCLNIQGIIGSNLLRFTNATINQQDKYIVLSDEPNKLKTLGFSIPFITDHQYNIYIDLKFENATIKNVLVDYGSNGSVSFDKYVFSKLKEQGIIKKTAIEKGVQQAGIIGEPIKFIRELTTTNGLLIGNHNLKNVEIRTGQTTSIGNEVLSKFLITIDWKTKTLHFVKNDPTSYNKEYYGFKLGFSENKNVFVQSVIENSQAQKLGILPNFEVTKLEEINFIKTNDFCDYINLEKKKKVSLEIVDNRGQLRVFTISKEPLSNLLKAVNGN